VRVEDMVLISIDDHVVEPPEMFQGRIPAAFADLAPKVVRTDDGDDVWVFDGQTIPNIGLNAVAGKPREEYGVEPTAFEEMRPGCYDVHERVKDMSAGGVLASMNFPSFPSFSGRLFLGTGDKELAAAVVRAYNDWHIEGWCGAYPDRFIPMAIPMLWDPELTAQEIRRVAELGCHSLTFTENPFTLGLPSFHSDHWNPMWRALEETGTVLNVHLGSSGQLAVTAPDAPINVMITLQPMNVCMAAADLLYAKALREFPSVKVALSEGGTGWVPYFLERVDHSYQLHGNWTGQDFGDGKLPSDLFRERFLTCFITDDIGLRLRHDIGIHSVCWEMDYPHSDGLWPDAPETLHAAAERLSVPDAELDLITHENAMRHYRFDPFSIRGRDRCTVGALRSEVAGHDVSIRSYDQHRRDRSVPSLGELAKRAGA
jgi:predicted TIM-barrel fold metal-dependent hydrolase